MDITSFSEENFDTKTWINDILKTSSDSERKDNNTMSLVMKLQLYVQQVNNSLEETSRNVLASMPKIIRDTKGLQQEAFTLKEKMEQVREEIVRIEQETGKSINTIERLDQMKIQLMDAKQGLHESDNWTVLVNDLEEVFDSKNIPNISAKLLGMQQSLKLLVNIADYEDRKLQLEGLKNRLEAIASPAIVQAFSTANIEQSLLYAKTFDSIGRLQQLLKYYHKCQKDLLIKRWREQLDEQEDSAIQWVHNYFIILISNWHGQYKWFNQVFPKEPAGACLVDLYIDVLASLDPSMNECFDAALKQTSDKLNFLQEIKETLKQFSENMQEIVKGISTVSSEKSMILLQTIYSPLMPYISKYSSYEQGFLSHKLTTINCIKEELQDTIQSLGFSITPVMDMAKDAHKRCKTITEHCGYCGLLLAYRVFFVTYGDQFRVALRQIDRRNEKKEDWARFQLCMSLLQNCGDVLNNLQSFEKELTNSLLQPGVGDFKTLLLDAAERKEFESLVKCVTEGTRLSLLDHVIGEFSKLCSDVHHTTFQVVFGPISVHLDVVQLGKTWAQFSESYSHQNDLPDYSLSPQEYITQIGQYLMTLPQHLEPFLFRENPSLNCALKVADTEYSNTEEEGAMADTFLRIVARGTCQTYCDRILSICELSNAACRQLAHDISYLGSVFEDLGLTLSENLQQVMTLLKLQPEQYQTQSAGCSARYVAAIRQMRNITSS